MRTFLFPQVSSNSSAEDPVLLPYSLDLHHMQRAAIEIEFLHQFLSSKECTLYSIFRNRDYSKSSFNKHQFNGQISLVSPTYSPVYMLVLRHNTMVGTLWMCTSSVTPAPPQKIVSISRQISKMTT
jgi:hypothetical protein